MTRAATPFTTALQQTRPLLLELWRVHQDVIRNSLATEGKQIDMGAHAACLAVLALAHSECPPSFRALEQSRQELLAQIPIRTVVNPLVFDDEGDGNPVAVVSAVRKQMRRMRWPGGLLEAYGTDALGNDYDQVLQVTMIWCEDPLE